MRYHYFNFTFWSDGIKILGAILGIAGIGVVLATFIFPEEQNLKTYLVAAGALIISFGLLSSFDGVIFDFQKNRYQAYEQWFGFRFGDWKDLPKLDAVDLIEHEFTKKNTPNGISPTFTSHIHVYKCVLFAGRERFWVLDFSSPKKASRAMEVLSDGIKSLKSSNGDSSFIEGL